MQNLKISAIPGRVARLLPHGLVGQALSAADAARVATEGRRIQSEINALTRKIQHLKSQKEKLSAEKDNLWQNIQDGQTSFGFYTCHKLGYSHENLNAP